MLCSSDGLICPELRLTQGSAWQYKEPAAYVPAILGFLGSLLATDNLLKPPLPTHKRLTLLLYIVIVISVIACLFLSTDDPGDTEYDAITVCNFSPECQGVIPVINEPI